MLKCHYCYLIFERSSSTDLLWSSPPRKLFCFSYPFCKTNANIPRKPTLLTLTPMDSRSGNAGARLSNGSSHCDPRHNSSNGQATQIRDQRPRWRKGVETLWIVCWALNWIHNHRVDSSFVNSSFTLECSLEYICGVDADECVLLGKRIIVRVGTQYNHARICNIGYTLIFCGWINFGETMRRMCTKISIAPIHFETNLFSNHTVNCTISEWMQQRT